MFRRSRFSFRPNVSTAGRTAAAAAPQEAPPANQEASETPRDVSESSPPPAVTDTKTVVTPSEKPTAPGDGNDQNGEGTSSSAAVQRRKRFSVKPKVAPGRTSALSRTPKSPVKAVSETPVEVPVSHLDKPTTSSQTGAAAVPQGLQSPKRRRPSGESKQPKVQPPPTPIPSDSPGPSAVPQAEESPEQTNLPTDSGKQLESKSGTRGKDVPPRPSDKVPPSLPDKEAVEISEKAKTLVSLKSGLSLSPSAFSLSRLLNDPSDLQRLAKAQKLRELLKQERHKEKKLKKAKTRPKEYTLDPAKMTMRDLIRYLPLSNPMTSSLEESVQENETVVPPSPVREESPERAQEPEDLPKLASPRGEEEEEVAEEEDQDDSLMVPQVKVAEDGSLIIDEESLTVEVQRAKGPNPAQDRDPIFERGSTTTYSSFRKGTYSKPWSSEETDMFFLAISMVGTDFSMICQLFPHRARSEIKNKFKKEERENAWRIDKAFRERRKLDIEYFSKLLEKVLEFQKNRKKLKKLTEKNSPKKHKRKAKGKKAAKKLSDVEEEDEEDENEVPDLEDEEEEGEKENEDLCNEGGTPVAKPKRQRKRKTKQAAMNEEPNEKKKKTDEQSSEQGEACTPEQTEAALPEDGTSPDMSEKTDSVDASKDTAIKPAKLSRGRAPKPLLPLGRKWGKKAPPPSTKAKDTASDKGDESVSDGASKEQENKDSSPSRQANKRKSANTDISSEEEDAAVQHPRPTRYGRVPKPINPLNYPAKEDAHTSATEPTPSSPEGSTASVAKPKPKCSAKRGRSSKQKSTQESKKPKLVTLRATRLDYSDDEDEKQRDHEEIEEEEEHPACSPSKDSIAPVFVPASLRSPQPVISEVEETMEEDVIDFLSSEHTEVSEDESYNEAAQTLLTIGNLTHLPQSVQNQLDTQDHITGTTSVSVIETTQHLEEETAPKPAALQEENSATPLMSGHGVTETPETVATVDPQYSTTDGDNFSIIKTSDQICVEQSTVSDMDPSPQLQSGPESSKKDSPQTRRGRLSKVKPKPNLGRASRTAQAKFPPDTSTAQIAEDSNTEGTNIQVTDSLSAPEETAPKTPEYSPMLLIGDTVSQVESGATTSENQSQCRDANPTPISKVHDKPITGVELEATCDTSLENPSQSTGPPSFDLGSTLTPTDELSTTEGGRTDDGLVGQVYFVTATSDQSTSENQNLSEDLFEESKTHGETTESSNNLVTSDSAVTESEVGHDTAPVQESSVQPATCVTPVEDLPVSQKSESEVASTSTCQSRRSRLQKVKPKPNLPKTSRTARSTPQTAKDPLEKDSSPTPVSKVPDKPIPEVEPEATCDTSPENPSQSTGPASFDLGSTLTPTQELSTTEERRTDDGLVGQVYSVTATSDQSTSENQNLSEDLFEPSSRDTGSTSESTDEKGTTCGKTTESSNNLVTSDSAVRESQVEEDTAPVQWRSDQPATCVTPVKDLPVSQKSERVVTSTCQTRKGRFQKVKPKPNLTQTARTAQSKPQTTKDPVTHMQLVERPPSPISKSGSTDSTIAAVEEQPICSITLPIKPSQSTDTASVSVPSLELCTTDKPAEESPSTVAHKTDVGLNSSSESSKPAVTQRRRHFPKVKPNLGSSTRTTQTKLQPKNISKPSEQQYTDTSSHVTSEQQPVDNSQTEVKFAEKDLSSDSERTLESTNDEYTSSDDALAASLVAENQSVLTDSVPENKSSENSSFERDSPGDKMSNNDGVEAGPSSRGDVSTRVSESNTQPPDDPAAVSDVQSSEEGSTESKINPVLAAGASSIPDPKESGPQPRSESDSEVKSQDAAQQYSEARETNQTSNDKSQSPQTANDADAKAPQTPRGRLIKPKPNLGPSSGTPQVQSTTQAEADSGSHSEDVHASVSHEPVCELQPDIQEPVEGAVEPHISQESSLNDSGSLLGCLTEIIEQLSQHDSPRNDAGSSLGCVTQAQDHSSQSTSTLSIEGTQSRPSLTIFPEMLSEQVPSDPDEPFFILSLTEIPVCSSGQVVDSAAEPLPYLPAADASIEHRSSVPGESLASAGEGSLSDVPVLMCTEESGEVGHVGVKDAGPDPAAYIDSITENPVDPPESTTCQPPESPETAEKNEETEISPTKQRLTRRRAKLQVKPNATRKKHAGKSLATNTDRDSELPEASTQPDASDATAKQDDEVDAEPQKRSGDHVNIKKEGPAGEKDPEDRSSGAQTRTTKTRATSVGNSAAPLNDPSPGDAASRGPKVKTPRTTRKHSTPATPVASTSHNFASTPNQTQLPDDTHSPSTTSLALTEVDIELTPEHNRLCSDSTPSTSQSTDEVSASQGSDCVESGSAEEEPTSVSQYFLTDIFTEVEEG